jgi:catechol 2,3-dioxygenase-like lactoylglutathione lyase family enzyme
MATSFQVTFDCADPDALSKFWAALLGYGFQPPPDGFASWEAWARDAGIPEESWNDAAATIDPDGRGPRLFFQRVPEGKTAKNRVHLDVNVGAGLHGEERHERVRREAERAVGLGASQVSVIDQRGEFWIVLADPEGNELCLQ